MANPEHVSLLKMGKSYWGDWRKRNPSISPQLEGAHLSGEHFRGEYLKGANLIGANLVNAKLIKANLTGANLRGANLNKANLAGANLSEANLIEANLSDADLVKAKLIKAKLIKANLVRAKLIEANLFEANLREANLVKANLVNANLENAVIFETIFTNIDLSNTKGLDKLQAYDHSVVDHRTLLQSKNLPEKFLRDCGFPERFIEHLPGLINSLEPIQFYSCFISHSSKDEEFAQRIYADLQAQGVRCWYAPENFKCGDEIIPTIDHAIRVHEKLLLIFSENSITSAWVKKEVKEAMATEKGKGKKNVLFPIRLDDSIMDTTEQWADDVRRERHIGDFRNWKDHDAYQKSFARLLRDLKNEGT